MQVPSNPGRQAKRPGKTGSLRRTKSVNNSKQELNGAARKRTGLKELAAYLGLSQTTVSFVINDVPQAKNLAEDTRRRVLEAARKFNYRPSYFAVNLHKTRSGSVGVIVPEHSEGYFTMVMEGVERFLMRKNYVYFTACHYWKPNLIDQYSRLLVDRGAEGLLFLNTDAEIETTLPVVTVSAHK